MPAETSSAVTPDADATPPRLKGPRPPSRKLVTAVPAGFMCGQSRTSWDRLTVLEKNPKPVMLGGRKFWRTNELDAWILAGCPPRAEWTPQWEAIVAVRLKAKRGREPATGRLEPASQPDRRAETPQGQPVATGG